MGLVRFPNTSNRTVVIGRTGTGKTVAGLWHLSNYDLQNFPFIVLDFKFDDHVASIENALNIDYDYIPRDGEAGLFVLHPSPHDAKGSDSPLDKYLWKIWQRERIGVFVDEAFMLGDGDAFNACLTQGRSKRVPLIVCTQRPAWISRFAFSEASYVQVFDLNDSRDISTIEQFVPLRWDEEPPLKPHCSFYYDIDKNHLTRFSPVPPMDVIRKTFAAKLPRKKVRI